MYTETKWIIKYDIEGVTYQAGPYNQRDVMSHANDIGGLYGGLNVRVEKMPDPVELLEYENKSGVPSGSLNDHRYEF